LKTKSLVEEYQRKQNRNENAITMLTAVASVLMLYYLCKHSLLVVSMERANWRKMFSDVARFCSLQKKSVSECIKLYISQHH
jgi:hypothetical protein